MHKTKFHKDSLLNDYWLVAALAVTVTAYILLVFLHPTGEGWGRGWNMIAFLMFAAPATILAGAVALWRSIKGSATTGKTAALVAAAGLAFPIVTILVMRVRS